MTAFETALDTYIDRCIIDEHANKSTIDGYSLDVYNLPKNEIAHFVDRILESDTEIKELLFMHMQELVDKRLPIVEFYNIGDLRRERAA